MKFSYKTNAILVASLSMAAYGIVSRYSSPADTSPVQQQELPPLNQYIVSGNKARALKATPLQEEATSSDYPVVDLAPWTSEENFSDSDREAVVDQILQYASQDGSWNVINHGIPQDLLNSLEQTSEDFFAQPLEEKNAYASKDNHITGYVALGSENIAALYGRKRKDFRQGYSAMEPPLNAKTGPPSLHPLVEEFTSQAKKLEVLLHVILTRGLAKAKHVELPDDFLEQARTNMLSILRINSYTSDSGPQDAQSEARSQQESHKLGVHSDWGTVTILHSNQAGLEEIRGQQWSRVPIRHGELHVSLGDMLHFISNGLFTNNVHRVSSQAATGRLSLAWFSTNIQHGEVKEMTPVCDSEEEALFEPFRPNEYFGAYFNAMANLK